MSGNGQCCKWTLSLIHPLVQHAQHPSVCSTSFQTCPFPILHGRRGYHIERPPFLELGGSPIMSCQETPGFSSIPVSPRFVWLLQKPLSSLGISGPLRHLQSPSSISRSLWPPHTLKHHCWSYPSCHPSQQQGCNHGAQGRRHSRRSEGSFMPFFPHPVLSLCEWFHPLDGKTCHPLQVSLEVFHLSGFPVAQLGAAGHVHVPCA